MAIAEQTMTDEQRKSVALEYLKAFDNAGVTSTGGSILDLFADDAQVFFPKWGVATGKDEIGRLFTDVGGAIKGVPHDYATFNWVMTGTDTFACEGTSAGEHRDGAGAPGVTHAGRWCDVFEVRDFLIQRCFVYLDPDYAGLDTVATPGCPRAGATRPSRSRRRSGRRAGEGQGTGLAPHLEAQQLILVSARQLSAPGPPLAMSAPLPPRRESGPVPPCMTSGPLPPLMTSGPFPPFRTSAPPLPLMTSAPPRPQITSTARRAVQHVCAGGAGFGAAADRRWW